MCGKNNPHGLHLHWHNNYEANQVEAEFQLTDDYCSYPGVMHGGIIATILDETSGRAILLKNDFNRLMVTLKMEVTYKKVTPTNTPLKAVGRIKKDSGSRAVVEGEIVLPDGSISALCSCLVYKIPQQVKDNWGSEEDEWNNTTPSAQLIAEIEKELAAGKN